METDLGRGTLSFLEYLRVKVSSRFPVFILISVGLLWCVSVLVILCWPNFDFETLLGSLSNLQIEKSFLPFVAHIVCRARCFVSAFAVNIELNFCNDPDSVSISLLEPSVYVRFHPLYLFSMTSLNLFW